MGITQQIGASSLIKPGVIDNTAARPASPYEGQMVYEKDTDMLAIWNGSAWRYVGSAIPSVTSGIGGTVLQVVSTAVSTLVNNATATYIDTGLTATITPKSVTSKILVISNQSLYADTAIAEMGYALIRGSTTLDAQKAPVFSYGNAIVGQGVYNYLDTPSTTSATTYKTMFARLTGGGNIYANINNNAARMTLMEIAG